MRVAFIHPDLGLGGAERLVLDAALELRAAGHDVQLYTAFHDPARCFAETLQGGRRADWVHVRGGWLPRSLFGRLHALLACARCLLAAVAVLCSGRFDVVFLDQVSAPVALLRACSRAQVLFYCHFPDQLLATRSSHLRAAYRAPLDALEELTTGLARHSWPQAHRVLVNSLFTASVFATTFRRLHRRGLRPAVLYPAVALPPSSAISFTPTLDPAALRAAGVPKLPRDTRLLLSINRFERKKGLPLALRSFAELQPRESRLHLVLAGGFDPRLAENVEHLEELRAEARQLGLEERVTFLPSFADAAKVALLAAATVLLYTPQQEHFGMVPLEAMAAGRPVVACASGGPLESIVDGVTGALCEPTPAAFAAACRRLLDDSAAAEKAGRAARRRVEEHFSRTAFGAQLDKLVREMAACG